MIRAGIIGGSNPMAGELIRLLVNHPDVVITWVNSARYAGRLVSDVHHGLLGETNLRITPSVDLDAINVLFIFRHKGQTIEWLKDRAIPENLRIIDLSVDMQDPDVAAEHGFIYGLPELNRKVLVRGAKRAIVPHPVAALCALSLLPLAKDAALHSTLHVDVCGPRLGDLPDRTLEDISREIAFALKELHPTFNQQIEIGAADTSFDRAMSLTAYLPIDLDIADITRRYEEFYDDHNFIFIVKDGIPEAREVEGTNKCLIYLDKRDGNLRITSIMDALLKGAAGSAVHVMNLLFGLMERTGLYLKASTF